MEDTDGTQRAGGQTNDHAPRAAKLALERLHLFGGEPEMLLEKPF
jgi:hypothetical protein